MSGVLLLPNMPYVIKFLSLLLQLGLPSSISKLFFLSLSSNVTSPGKLSLVYWGKLNNLSPMFLLSSTQADKALVTL